jgi:hypothetical protein
VEDSEFHWIECGGGEAYHLVEVQALGKLGLGVHRGVVGDQDMVCEYGFCCLPACVMTRVAG